MGRVEEGLGGVEEGCKRVGVREGVKDWVGGWG